MWQASNIDKTSETLIR